VKNLLGHWEKLTCRAAFALLVAACLVSAGSVTSASAGAGLTLLAGFRRRGGLFFETKVGAFDSPDCKLAVGCTFR
jgi:hypothetical protein